MSIREPLKALALFIAAFILCGCVKDTTLDAGLERKVVVEFVRVSDNQWTLDYAGIPGHEYRLEVKADGYDLVWAEQIMPEKVELARAAIGHGVPPKYTGYGAFYTIDSIPDFLIIRGTKRNKETGEYVMVEDLCTDYPGVEDINATGRLYDGNPKWRTGVAWGGDPFVYHDSPVAGMDGVWTYMFPNLIGKELHDGFLLIKRVDDNHAGLDNLYDFENGKGFCISGSFYINHAYYNPDYTLIDYDEYLLYSSLSPDYGQFLKDVWQLKKVHEGDDLSSIYLRDNIHSNIQGGLGIFGTSVSDRVNFDGYNQDTTSLPKIEL